jgi:hypothetical protein
MGGIRHHSTTWHIRFRALLSVTPVLVILIWPCIVAAKPLTRVPFTYVIDYRPGQLGDEELIRRIREASPTLYHTGFGPTLFSSTWGGGAHVEPDAMKLHSPDELRARTGMIKQFNDALHAAGVTLVIPYLCNQSLFGDHELRTGFWEFYDRWDEYAEFDIGAKPPADPVEWLQREPSGSIHYNYPRHLIHSDERPYYRYAPCPNNEHWRQFCAATARAAARCGYDGLFIDNNILHCYCSSCQGGFKKYLQRKYSPEQLADRFGTADVSALSLSTAGDVIMWARSYPSFVEFLEDKFQGGERKNAFWTTDALTNIDIDGAGGGFLVGQAEEFIRTHVLGDKKIYNFEELRNANPSLRDRHAKLLWAETKRFWADSIGEMLSMIETAGKEVNPDFFTLPNWGSMVRVRGTAGRSEDAHDMRRWLPAGWIQMYEEDATPGTVLPGLTFDYVLQYKFALANGIQAAVLPYTLTSPDIFDLAHAEASASGGGVYIQPGLAYPQVRKKYREVFEGHPELFSDYVSYAQVAVAYWFDQLHMNNVNHFRVVNKIARYLTDQQIPFDFLTEHDWNLDSLLQYKVLVVPEITYMSDEQLRTVRNYVRTGGNVATVGTTGTFDELARPRKGESNFLAHPGPAHRYAENRYRRGASLRAWQLRDLLPADSFSLEKAFQICRDGHLQRAFGTDGDAKYLVVAKLDELIGVDRLWDGGKLAEFIKDELGYDPSMADPESALGVRLIPYIKEGSTTTHVAVHVVNYNIPLTAEGESLMVEPVSRLTVRLTLPRGLRVQKTVMYDPDERQAEAVEFKQASTTLRLTIPTLRIYKLIDIVASSER